MFIRACPRDPFAPIISSSSYRMETVITSKNIVGSWIQHEQGWSIARYEGFVFLEPVEE